MHVKFLETKEEMPLLSEIDNFESKNLNFLDEKPTTALHEFELPPIHETDAQREAYGGSDSEVKLPALEKRSTEPPPIIKDI